MDPVPQNLKHSPDAKTRIVAADVLQKLVAEIFRRVGSDEHEASRLAHYLVESNLAGHDSHGVIRVSYYVDYVQRGQVQVNRHARVEHDTGSLLVVNGDGGFGQIIAEEAMQMAIDRTAQLGVCVLSLRNCGHLGRVGDWPQMAALAGKVSFHFVNTSGFGLLVAPFGGIDRRLSANPIAAGIPRPDGPPIVLDISTASIAEGKLKVARNRGDRVPSYCIIDADGNPTDNPNHFYTDPPGAILPFGGHKGYGLGIVAELMAGAVAGSGCSQPGADRLINGMLAIVIDPAKIPRDTSFAEEVQVFVDFVKSSRRIDAEKPVLVPGELEASTRERRLADGIPIDAATRHELLKTARSLGLDSATISGLE